MITSRSNAEVKAAAALRHRSEREHTNLCLIEGELEVGRAIYAGVDIETLYVREGAVTSLVEKVQRVVTLSGQPFDRIAYRRSGVVAVAHRPRFKLEEIRLPTPALLLIVEGLEKPGNLGAILRTADAVGAVVVAASPITDLTNPNVIRSSLGTVFTVELAACPTEEVVRFLHQHEMRLGVAVVEGGVPPWRADLTETIALAIGSEQSGLSTVLIDASNMRLTLPMTGAADSLNASAAAAVLLYEAVRQRTEGRGP